MLLAIQIKNFARSDHRFSFLADRSDNTFSDHLIKLKHNNFSGSFLPVAAFKLPSEKPCFFFQALSFLRQLITADKANLNHENCIPFLPHIRSQAEFSLVFRIFGMLYLYNLNLTQEKIIAESLYANIDFCPQKPFSASGTCVFQRTEQDFPVLGVHPDFSEHIKSTQANTCILSLFKEKNVHTADLYSAHTWFRKELFDFHEQNFLDFMAKRGNPEQGARLLNSLTLQPSEFIAYLSKKQLKQLAGSDNRQFAVYCGSQKISLREQTDAASPITLDFECSKEFLQKFLSCLHALTNEKYRVFVLQNITDAVQDLFGMLLIKTFLTRRQDSYNQIFFSDKDSKLFESAPLRKEEIF